MSVKMYKESGSEDIARSCWVYLVGGISGKLLCNALPEKGGAVPAVGGDQQRDLHAPAGQDGVGIGTVAVGEWQQVVMA